MRDTILWRLCAKECAWIDCDTKYEWISDMKKLFENWRKHLNEVSMDDVHKLFVKYDLPEKEEQLVIKAAEQAVLNKDKVMFDNLPANLKAAAKELIDINMQLRKDL